MGRGAHLPHDLERALHERGGDHGEHARDDLGHRQQREPAHSLRAAAAADAAISRIARRCAAVSGTFGSAAAAPRGAGGGRNTFGAAGGEWAAPPPQDAGSGLRRVGDDARRLAKTRERR